MKNKLGFISVSVVILEFIGFLIWGFNMHPGDEMGFGLIVIYGIMPMTALILSLILTVRNSIFIIPTVILAILSHIFLPFLIYGTFEIALSLCLSAIPCTFGALIGFIIKLFRE